MANSRSSDTAAVIAAILVLVLLLAAAGGVFMWMVYQRQSAMVQAERAMAQQARLVAEESRAVAEQRLVEASAQAGADVSQSVDSEVVNTAIQNVLETQQQAWNAGDIDKFMEFYWKSDNLTFSSGGKITRGWQSTLENYKTRYPSVAEMGQLTFGDLQITLLGSDAALVLGEWHLSRESQGVEDVGGKFSLVLRRIDDQWLIIHDHTSRSEQP